VGEFGDDLGAQAVATTAGGSRRVGEPLGEEAVEQAEPRLPALRGVEPVGPLGGGRAEQVVERYRGAGQLARRHAEQHAGGERREVDLDAVLIAVMLDERRRRVEAGGEGDPHRRRTGECGRVEHAHGRAEAHDERTSPVAASRRRSGAAVHSR
jgi:hypothetical protein